MISYARLLKEQEILAAHMQPNTYRFADMDTNNPYVIMAAMTNSGKVYTLKIHLENFPESVPQVEVLNPLKGRNGKKLCKVSAEMHVLGTRDGHTLICYYSSASWTPQVSLYKVFIKCRLWLEMYEEHLATGYDMDVFLKHQK